MNYVSSGRSDFALHVVERCSAQRRFTLRCASLALALPCMLTDKAVVNAEVSLPGAAALAGWLTEKPDALAVVMVSLPGCPFCEIVRREQLAPMLKDSAFSKIGVFEISSRDTSSRLPLQGEFASVGSQSDPTPAELSRQLKIRMSPTLLFINRSSTLAEPLVGYPGPDFYWSILSERIGIARAAISSGSRRPRPR